MAQRRSNVRSCYEERQEPLTACCLRCSKRLSIDPHGRCRTRSGQRTCRPCRKQHVKCEKVPHKFIGYVKGLMAATRKLPANRDNSVKDEFHARIARYTRRVEAHIAARRIDFQQANAGWFLQERLCEAVEHLTCILKFRYNIEDSDDDEESEGDPSSSETESDDEGSTE